MKIFFKKIIMPMLETEIFCWCETCGEMVRAVPNRNGTGYELDKSSEHIGHQINYQKTIPNIFFHHKNKLSKLDMLVASRHVGHSFWERIKIQKPNKKYF